MARRIYQGLQSSFLQVNIAEIVIHKAVEPDPEVGFFEADGLTGERSTEIDFLAVQTQSAATGDHNGAVVEGIVRFRNALIGSDGSRVDLRRALDGESFMGTLVVEVLNEDIELGLLLKEIGAGWSSGFLLESQVHAFMPAVLLRMTGANAFDADA